VVPGTTERDYGLIELAIVRGRGALEDEKLVDGDAELGREDF